MTVSIRSKTMIIFSNEELDTIDRMSGILENIRAELDNQEEDTFEVNGTVYNDDTIKEMLELCYDLTSDNITIEKYDDGER